MTAEKDTGEKAATSSDNPWLMALGLLAAGVGITGLILMGVNADPMSRDYSAVGALAGQALFGSGLMLLAGPLVAGAICWQLQRR